MKKTLLIIRREYGTRIRKPSFWILTIVMPILLALLYAIPIYMAMKPAAKSVVIVADESGIFGGIDRDDPAMGDSKFTSNENTEYRYASSYASALRLMERDDADAVLYIRSRASEAIPTDACLYYRTDPPTSTTRMDIDRQLQQILRNRLLRAHGITDDEYALISNTRINLRTEDLETGRDAFLEVKTVLGIVLSMLILLTIIMFGSQVMRGVVEEKTNRIVEVVICSVKPFQLMMGKVVGIALVGLTQFMLWIVLTGIALAGITASNAEILGNATARHEITEIATKGSDATSQSLQAAEQDKVPQIVEGMISIDFGAIVPAFLFYAIMGYLLYATLFAAAGALSDTDTDAQNFSFPLTLPLILTMVTIPSIIDAPSGALGTALSIIPFTSPAAMMLRIPFGVPYSQLYLSMALLVLTFPLCTWGAARIYRKSILRHGFKFLRRK